MRFIYPRISFTIKVVTNKYFNMDGDISQLDLTLRVSNDKRFCSSVLAGHLHSNFTGYFLFLPLCHQVITVDLQVE